MKKFVCSLVLIGILCLLPACCWNRPLKKCTICAQNHEVIQDSIDFD